MPGPIHFTRQIAQSSPVELASLMRRLLQLEAAKLSLPIGATNATVRVNVADQGEDGISIDIPEGAPTRLPGGTTLFQFKTTGTVGDVKADVAVEVKKARPQQVLAAGGHYIYVWSRDATGLELSAALTALEDAASEHKGRLHVWGAGQIEDLCHDNPGVALEFDLAPVRGVLAFSVWARGQKDKVRNFVPDDERKEKIQAIQELVLHSSDVCLFHLSGDAGVGKSRLVCEALDLDTIRDRVLVAVRPDSAGDFINYVASSPTASCVLVVDDLPLDDLEPLRRSVSMAEGRIQLITLGLPGGRRWLRPQGTDLELSPMSAEALRRLLEEELQAPSDEAQWIASISAGFPRLAIAVAEYRASAGTGTLGQTVTGQGIDQVLSRMFGDDNLRRDLGVLSLFTAVGLEGEVQGEIDAIARAFGRDPGLLRTCAQQEIGRFVSPAGRLCSVTPALVAAWLTTQMLMELGSGVADRIAGLPPPLPDRFRDQLAGLGEAPPVAHIIGEILTRPEFEQASGFDLAAARFLHSAAAINPEQVSAKLARIFEQLDDPQLRSRTFPRREVVRALEQLLWPVEQFAIAADLLLRLAQNETETYANNASGVLVDSFQMHLGGTTAPIFLRLAWLRSAASARDQQADRSLFARAAAAALRVHESRMHGARPGVLEPLDWRPETPDEELRGRRIALGLLVEQLDQSPPQSRDGVFAELSGAVRACVTFGLAGDLLTCIARREWSIIERVALLDGLQHAIAHDRIADADRDAASNAIQLLSGHTLEERLLLALNTKPWDLRARDESWDQAPAVLVELAAAALQRERGLALALELAGDVPDEQTPYLFFREYARQSDLVPSALEEIKEGLPSSLAAYHAWLSVEQDQGHETLVDAELALAAQDPMLVNSLVSLIRATRLTDERLALVLGCIDRGTLRRESLGQLLYGAAITNVSDLDLAVQLLHETASAGSVGLEHAAGMLRQYAEARPGVVENPTAKHLALSLAGALEGDTNATSMGRHQAIGLIGLFRFSASEAWHVLMPRLRETDSMLDPEEEDLLEGLVSRAPKTSALVLFPLLGTIGTARGPLRSSRMALLSKLATGTGTDFVWDWMTGLSESALLSAIRHLDWGAASPDDLTRRLLCEPPHDWVWNEASVGFFNSLGVVSGPFHYGLMRQRNRALDWHRALEGSSAEHWADELVGSLERDIAREELRDAEESVDR